MDTNIEDGIEISRADAERVVQLVEQCFAPWLKDVERTDWSHPRLYGWEHESLRPGCWSIAWEGYGPSDWAYYFPAGGRTEDYGITARDVRHAMPSGIHIEAINNCIIALYPDPQP